MKRILVATDLNPRGTNVIARAIRLAAEGGASLRIVHAAKETDPPENCPAAHRRIETEARIMAEELTDIPLDISVSISSRMASHAILRSAESFDADLVVLGAHGVPRFRDALFGTTGTHVVRHCDRPVLIVQNEACEPYLKVLVAVDEAKAARPIVEMAMDVAPKGELFAVHAFSPSLHALLAGSDERAREKQALEAEFEQLLAEAGAGGPERRFTANKHGIVESDEALTLVMNETEELLPDLLVMGTRRRATYLGSHAVDTLFWCPNDVLVVPERAFANAPAAAEA